MVMSPLIMEVSSFAGMNNIHISAYRVCKVVAIGRRAGVADCAKSITAKASLFELSTSRVRPCCGNAIARAKKANF